jgi:hypothetical protein
MLVANADMLLQMAAMQRGSAGGPGGMPNMGGGMPGGGMEGLQLPGIVP